MTSPDAKVEKEEASANTCSPVVPPEQKSGASSSSSSSSFTGTTASLGQKTTDTGGTTPEKVFGQNAAQGIERIETGGGPATTSGTSNEQKLPESDAAEDASRTTSPTSSKTGISSPDRRTNDEEVPDMAGDNAAQQPQEQKSDDDDERFRHEMDSNRQRQHREARLVPHKFKRRKVAAVAAAAVNEEVQDASTSTTVGTSNPGEGISSMTTSMHSSSSAAVPAAQPAPAAPGVSPNSATNQYQQLQALVAQKREQLVSALLAQQQLSAAASASAAAQARAQAQGQAQGNSLGTLGDLSGAAAASIGLGLGALGTTGASPSQASKNSAAANLAQVQAQVQAAAALSNPSTQPSLGSLTLDSALKILMGTATSPLSSPNRTLPSRFAGSPTYNPLTTGLDLTAIANAMLQQQADLGRLQQLRAQRSLLSSISASSAAASLSASAATAGLPPNDVTILARLQSEVTRAGGGTSSLSTSSFSVGSPSATSVSSPSPAAAAAAQSQSQGYGHTQEGMLVPVASDGNGPRRISKAPPLPNITPAAAKAPADQRTTRSDGVVCLSSGLSHYTNRTIVPLSAPDDVHWLSNYLCFVRNKCVEIFEADAAEINGRSSSKLINDRQIGIRCRYCAHIHQRDRAGRSTSFPSSLSRIYQSLTMMLREHFPTCTEMPPAVKERFLALKGQKASGPGQDKRQLRGSDVSAKESRSYWVDSAKDSGLYDTELGIKRRTAPAQAVQDSSGQGS